MPTHGSQFDNLHLRRNRIVYISCAKRYCSFLIECNLLSNQNEVARIFKINNLAFIEDYL